MSQGNAASITIAPLIAAMQALGLIVNTSSKPVPADPGAGAAAAAALNAAAAAAAPAIAAAAAAGPLAAADVHVHDDDEEPLSGPLVVISHSTLTDGQEALAYICGHCFGFNRLRRPSDPWYAVTVGLTTGIFDNQYVLVLPYLVESTDFFFSELAREQIFQVSGGAFKHFKTCQEAQAYYDQAVATGKVSQVTR